MVKKQLKTSKDNFLFSKFKKETGSRAEVYHGTAFSTTGGLEKKHLTKNKQWRIVSLKKSKSSKNPELNPLLKQGHQQPKGSTEFGPKKEKNTKQKNNKSLKSPGIFGNIKNFFFD
jgi:hypothetical protein